MSLQLKMLGKGFVKTNCRSKKGKNRSKSITYWIQQDRAKQWSLFHTSSDPAWPSWSMEGSMNRCGWFMFWYCYENFVLPPKVCEQKYPRSNATETVQPHLEDIIKHLINNIKSSILAPFSSQLQFIFLSTLLFSKYEVVDKSESRLVGEKEEKWKIHLWAKLFQNISKMGK